MKHCSRPLFKEWGLSIPELLIACGLFAMVTTAIATVMREGIRFFNTHSTALEVQQQCLQAMDRVSLELSEASVSSYKSYRTASQSGLVWGSLKNGEGETTVDPNTGEPQWHKYIGYYTDKSGDIPLLIRKEVPLMRQESPLDEPVPAPVTTPPPPLTVPELESADGNRAVVARYIVELYSSNSNPTKLTLKADYMSGRFTMKLHTFILLRN